MDIFLSIVCVHHSFTHLLLVILMNPFLAALFFCPLTWLTFMSTSVQTKQPTIFRATSALINAKQWLPPPLTANLNMQQVFKEDR